MPYTPPTADDLKTRFPAFSGVDDAVVEYWIDDAARVVDESWPENSFAPAIMAHAAHMMTEVGVLGGGAIPAGVTSFKSGTFSATISDRVASATGYGTSFYGRQFLALRRAAFMGPRPAWTPPARVR